MDADLIERLSDAEHYSWARWMDYLFSKSATLSDGSVCIPPQLVERWKRQAMTPYANLSESEKEPDRSEVRRIVPLIEAAYAQSEAAPRL